MGLLSRGPDVSVAVSPAVVTPRQVVTATVTTSSPVRKVTAASLEWGYTNFYRYHWAGRADSAAAGASEAMWITGDVGTNAGGDRDTDDWICVTRVELPLATGEFDGATSTFKVPSWAPASSKEIARWGCRLVVERSGRDIDTYGEFTVRTGPDDLVAEGAENEPVTVSGGAAETVIDIVLGEVPLFLTGGVIRGAVTLTPTVDLPDGDLAVCWQKQRASHPLRRTPTSGSAVDGPILTLGKRIPLRAGATVTLPFEIPVPADAPATATAVNSSMEWFVQARMFYAGFTGHMTERVLKPIVIVNGPL